MDYSLLLLMFGLCLTIYGYVTYIRWILIGSNKPHPVSRFIWCMMTAIGTFAQLSETDSLGVRIGILSLVAQVIVIVLSYKNYNLTSLSRYDWISWIIGIIAIIAWWLTWSPLWSVYLICIADAIGYIPTFIKCLDKPHQEYLMIYLMAAMKWWVNLLLLDDYSIIAALYPVYIVVINLLFPIYVLWRRKYLKVHNS